MPLDVADLGRLPDRRRTPMEIVREQNAARLERLLPLRRDRMLESPFAWFRGTAAVMAADLATAPSTGIHVLCCGDAHLGNFGYYASPQRTLLFDLNDFDEAAVAPWEWDLKRLVVSVYLCARENGIARKTARKLAKKTSKAYQRALLRLDRLSTLERFHSALDTSRLEAELDDAGARAFRHGARKARRCTSQQALEKFVVADVEGRPTVQDQPPLTLHAGTGADDAALSRLWEQYLDTVPPHIRYLFGKYQVVDHVLRVVGVGSVGTRCSIVLLMDADDHGLFLQIKEAVPSVLETYGGVEQPWRDVEHLGRPLATYGEGARVVTAQRILQAQSDEFLGSATLPHDAGYELFRGDFFVRQFRDMKGSVDLAGLDRDGLEATAQVCAGLLARAHAQSAQVHDVARFLREHDHVHRTLADFARDYGELATADFEEAQRTWEA